MEELIYVDRRNSNCNKWDGQTAMFGEEGLHAMWVADMDFKIPQCVQKALHEYVDFGAIGYYRIPDGYYDAFILCSPHNPVGRVWRKEELKEMLEICHRHHVYVISDEIHQDFVFGDKNQTPSYLMTEHWNEILTITAPSKTFNLAGGQNSFVIIADENLRAKWDDFAKRIRLMTGNAFGFVAAEAAYKGGQEWLDKVKKQIVDNDQYLRELFKENLPKVVVTPLEATYLVWIDLRAYIKPEDTKEFIQKKCRLAVDFGDWFGGDRFNGFIRMNLATSRENVEIGVKRIIDGILGEK